MTLFTRDSSPEPPFEADVPPRAEDDPPRRRRRRDRAVAGALGVALALAALALPRIGALRAAPRPSRTGTLVVESQPAGWRVWDGEEDRGATPVTMTLPAGSRTLVLRRGTATRQLLVEIRPGERAVYHVDLPGPPPFGDLHVDTKPAGALVAVDGMGRGNSPIDVRDLKAGRHLVTVLNGDRIFSESVTIEPGRAASLVVPLDQAGAPAVGWVVVRAPIDLEVHEGEALVGSSRNAKLMFMPGRHVLRFSNEDLNVTATRTVQVTPGATAPITVTLPPGSLSVNATPWAEVFLDGERIGETPIANFAVPLGAHEIVLRHPKFAERRRLVVVAQGAPVRLGVDLRE
jgi:hypothetical protein